MENTSLNTNVENAFNSIESIKRAEANPFLLTRVLEGLKKQTPKTLQPAVIWQVALSMVIVLAINIGVEAYTLGNRNNRNTPTQDGYFTNHIYTY